MSDHEFVAYIDESGDDGLKKFREPGGGGGSSHWLVLGCCMVRAKNDASLIKLRDEANASIGRTIKRDIHFHELQHAQKAVVIDHVRKMPIRLTSVLSCKKHIPDGIYNRKGQLYWYLCRYLIERISWCCALHSETCRPLVRLVFSNRGGLRYQEFRDYVGRLKETETRINWNVISSDEQFIRTETHERFAGLQIADITARSFAEAVEPNIYGYYEQSYANGLKPVVYEQGNNYKSYGVKPVARLADLDDAQRNFFNGYAAR